LRRQSSFHVRCRGGKKARSHFEYSVDFARNAPTPKDCKTCGPHSLCHSKTARNIHLVCGTVPPGTSFCFLSSTPECFGGPFEKRTKNIHKNRFFLSGESGRNPRFRRFIAAHQSICNLYIAKRWLTRSIGIFL
jgi:hypothetical protein